MLQEERGSVHADFMTILMTILCRFLGCLGMNILVIYITNIFSGGPAGGWGKDMRWYEGGGYPPESRCRAECANTPVLNGVGCNNVITLPKFWTFLSAITALQ